MGVGLGWAPYSEQRAYTNESGWRTFYHLSPCVGVGGFCASGNRTSILILDEAILDRDSFQPIIGELRTVERLSLVGLQFSDGTPANLNQLLSGPSLREIVIDSLVFDEYASELLAWDDLEQHTLVVGTPADVNSDGFGDTNDFDIIRGNFLQSVSQRLDGDLNLDGIVDFTITAFGKTLSTPRSLSEHSFQSQDVSTWRYWPLY